MIMRITPSPSGQGWLVCLYYGIELVACYNSAQLTEMGLSFVNPWTGIRLS